MSKQTLTTAVIAIALVVPLAGQKVKVPKTPAYTPCAIVGDLSSGESTVKVGRDVRTYGQTNEKLYIHDSLLPPLGSTDVPSVVADLRGLGLGPDDEGFYGPYYGQIRVLDTRIDYAFDTAPTECVEDTTSTNMCPFRLVVVDGTAVKNKKTLVRIEFEEGRYLLDYRSCNPVDDPDCRVQLFGCYDDRDCPGVDPDDPDGGYVYADLTVWFQ